MPYTEKQLSSEEIFNGVVFKVTKDQIRLVNGETALREVVHHNGGACVVALNEKTEVALVRQFRYAIGRETVELPAGKIEQGEDPRQSAIRELEEEAGLKAASFKDFGKILPTCAYCTEVIYIYLATELTSTQQNLDEDEFLDVFWLPLEQAVEMVMDGRIIDSKTVSGLMRAWQLHKNGEI